MINLITGEIIPDSGVDEKAHRKFLGSDYQYQKDYDEDHTVQVKLKLNKKTDADILKWIQAKRDDPHTSVQGSIKQLIREEIGKEEK